MRGRVLWILSGNEGYGVRRATLGMAASLRETGCDVNFAALKDGELAQLLSQSGYQVSILGNVDHDVARYSGASFIRYVYGHVREQWRLRRRLVSVVKTIRPHWIHIRSNTHLFLAGLVARSNHLPAYWHLPNTINRKLPFNLQALGYQLFCRWCDIRPLGNSRHTAESLGHRFVNTRVLYLGVDSVHFSPASSFQAISRRDVGLEESVPTFAIVARVVPDKAQDRVVDAVIELLGSGERVQLVIVGGPVESEFYRSLQSRVESAGVGHAVKLLPPVKDPRPWFVLADVVINSRVDAEPFGLTIVEAMLMERPVLAYRLGGPGETITDGVTGWLIEDCSVSAYKRGIERALQAKPQWAELGRAARSHALSKFSIDCTANQYLRYVEGDGTAA